MRACNARLSLAENVKRFAEIVSSHPYETDVRVGRHVVDGKSIPGILSLDLSKQVLVEVYSDHCDGLMAELAPFLVG